MDLKPEHPKRCWSGAVPLQDDFDKTIVASFIDGATIRGPWAIMTLESFKLYGLGLGLGVGQKYQLQDDGRWLKVAG
jgi:hypothetical protein